LPVLIEREDLRGRASVFRDRRDAGEALARMLEGRLDGEAVVLAIPSGGVPVAFPIARHLGLPLEVAVVSKITPPWSSEVGYGAVAFDGSVVVDHEIARAIGIDEAAMRQGIERTLRKVERRVGLFRAGAEALGLAGCTAILVDDGLASGVTLRAALMALRKAEIGRLIVAVPTGSARSLAALEHEVDELYCANVRGGLRFAVAEAYEQWSDVDEKEACQLLEIARGDRESGCDGSDGSEDGRDGAPLTLD
jgi:putative phosphoribosyl transferase